MQQQNLQAKQININASFWAEQKSVLSTLLPIFTFLSFVWLNLFSSFSTACQLNIGFLNRSGVVFFSLLFGGLIEYLIFEVLFFLYRFLIGFSIYSFMIPKQVMKDKFRLWYVIRNIVLGTFFNLRFFFPYIGTYLCVLELMSNMIMIIVLYKDLSRHYVEPLVGQFVFKTLALPVIIFELYKVIVLMVGVL